MVPDQYIDGICILRDGTDIKAYHVGPIHDKMNLNFHGAITCVAKKGAIQVAEHFGEKYYMDGGNDNDLTIGCPVPAWFVRTVPKTSAKSKKGTKKGAAPAADEPPLVCKVKVVEFEFKQLSFLKEIKHTIEVSIPMLSRNPEYNGRVGTLAQPLELTVHTIPGKVVVPPVKKGKGKKNKNTEVRKQPEWAHCQHLFK